jgi:diacylglycerol kinase (ATP)
MAPMHAAVLLLCVCCTSCTLGDAQGIQKWGAKEVGRWATGLVDLPSAEAEVFSEALIENEITGATLLSLSRDDIKELGITKLGHLKVVETAIGALKPANDDNKGEANAARARTLSVIQSVQPRLSGSPVQNGPSERSALSALSAQSETVRSDWQGNRVKSDSRANPRQRKNQKDFGTSYFHSWCWQRWGCEWLPWTS